jgi:hypothetical protein
MIRTDETALICDLAETYGIYDYRALPLKTVAALCSGLREDSRIMMKISGRKIPIETMLMASAVDRLSLLWWGQTKDGHNNKNQPDMLLDILLGIDRQEKNEKDFAVFRTPEEFEAARRKALNRGN